MSSAEEDLIMKTVSEIEYYMMDNYSVDAEDKKSRVVLSIYDRTRLLILSSPQSSQTQSSATPNLPSRSSSATTLNTWYA